jgi:hypothetical protein
VVLAGVLSFMGTPWYAVDTSPDQEAVAVLLPQTSPGPLRTADWDEIELGTYEARRWDEAPTSTLRELLETFNDEIEHFTDRRYVDPEGLMIVEDWQADLKKITLRVIWIDGYTGDPGEFSETVYFHRFSDYGQGE